jgi:hypothetical protein
VGGGSDVGGTRVGVFVAGGDVRGTVGAAILGIILVGVANKMGNRVVGTCPAEKD